jgi:uncharacterized protein YukE
MKNVFTAVVLSAALGFVPVLAQEKKDMPMKEGMPMKSEGMQGGGMMKGNMKEMHDKMMEMKKGMGGMMKGQAMMKSEEMKGMGGAMGDISGMMVNMGQTMGSGKMTPEEMSEMSKMMGDMSGMMKQMSERMRQGTKKAN